MKMLHITNTRIPTEKAHGVHIMKMCSSFAKAGLEVELLIPDRASPITQDPFNYYNVDEHFEITRLPTLDLVSWGPLGFWAQKLSFLLGAISYIRRSSADILYIRDPELISLCPFPRGRLLAWEIHTRIAISPRMLRKVRRLHIRVVVITGGVKRHLLEQGIPEAQIMIAPDGVDLSEFDFPDGKTALRADLHLPEDRTLVAYVGKLSTRGERKGVEEIVEAVGRLHAVDQRVGLLVVGVNANERAGLVGLTDAAGLPPNAAFLIEHVEHKEVARYLKAADILVMNYPNTDHYAHFMSPLKLFEYMASQTPIVTTDLPSIREILNDSAALFVRPDDEASLREGIQKLLTEEPLGRRLAQEALRLVQQYSWDSRARAIVAFIEKNL